MNRLSITQLASEGIFVGPETSKPPSAKRVYNQAILVKSIISQRRFLICLVAISCLLVFKQSSSAQTAQLTGIIRDTNLAVIAGAQITLSNLDTAVARKSVTNTDGYYSIPFVPPGHYRLQVFSIGFKPVTHESVRINVDQPIRIDFTLEIGAISESVNINGNAPQLESETSSIGHVIENKTSANVGFILFTTDRDDPSPLGMCPACEEIYVMLPDGSDQRRLTNNNANDSAASWSLGAKTIAFQTNRSGHTQIFLMNADGSDQRLLLDLGVNELGVQRGAQFPSWSPNGEQLCFSSQVRPREIFVVDAYGEGLTNVTNNPY